MSNGVVPPNTWIETPPCAPSDWLDVVIPPSTNGPLIVVQRTGALYYRAAAGQLTFPLSVADFYGFSGILDSSVGLAVTRNGVRLMLDDGSGIGGYTVNVGGNSVTLIMPAGDGEIIIIDLFSTG